MQTCFKPYYQPFWLSNTVFLSHENVGSFKVLIFQVLSIIYSESFGEWEPNLLGLNGPGKDGKVIT